MATGARVVVGVGESLAALQALRYAVTEARRRGSALRAVRVWRAGTPWHGYDVDQGRRQAGADADATILRSFEQAMGGLPRDLDFELIAVEGLIAPALAALASNDDDLLVVGAPSRRRLFPLSAVDRGCMRLASCPVVVVTAPALARTRGTRALARAIRHEAERLVLPDR
jgi:nucleotide-binding universal stress UspA family protein